MRHVNLILLVLIVWAALLSATAEAATPKGQDIKLRDGKTLHGVIRQIRSSQYLVQTENELYELTAEEIASVGGKPGIPPQDNVRPIHEVSHRIELRADGTSEMWTEEVITNRFDRVLTYAMFGAKERELPRIKSMESYDQYGNKLNVRVEPRAGTDLYNVFVDFVVPILPGETMRGSLRYKYTDQIHTEGKKCSNQFFGDMPEDRLLTRRVELPIGAKLTKVEPEPNLQFEHNGQTVVVWRRYYPASSEFPLKVEYELP